jgi:hypothetical protein
LPDGRTVSVFELASSQAGRRFLLTNPEGYSLIYNGLVMAVEKRRSDGWQGFVTYTFSRVSGLQASSGSAAARAQVSSVAGATQLTFGQDLNSLTNARGRLASLTGVGCPPNRSSGPEDALSMIVDFGLAKLGTATWSASRVSWATGTSPSLPTAS